MLIVCKEGVAQEHNYSFGARLIEQRQATLPPEELFCVAGKGIIRGEIDLGKLAVGSLTFENGKPAGHLRWHDFTGTKYFVDNKTGYFLPLFAKGETTAVHETIEDCLVVKLDEDTLGGTPLTIGETQLDCSGLTTDVPTGADAITVLYDQVFGECGSASNWIDKDVKIAWYGKYGEVTGTIKKCKEASHANTYQFPVGICSYYSGKSITIGTGTESTLLWHIALNAGKESVVNIKDGKDLIARLTFKDATFKE